MAQLLSQLGIDWHLLLAQGINFFLLLAVLWYVAYKPLMKLLRDRRARIEEGLVKADEADKRLLEIEEIGKEKVKEAENRALNILRKVETEGKDLEATLVAAAKQREAEQLANAKVLLQAQEEESRQAVEREAASFVRRAIAKTVELSPERFDEALIEKAVKEAKRTA